MQKSTSNGSIYEAYSKERGLMRDLLGDRSEVRVLTFLGQNPDTYFRQHTVADEIDMSQAMVSRTMAKLTDMGIVERTSDGVTMSDSDVAESVTDFVQTVAELDEDEE